MAFMTPDRTAAATMAQRSFVVQSGCFIEKTSSIKIWFITGTARPGTIMQSPKISTKRIAHLSSASFSATAFATL